MIVILKSIIALLMMSAGIWLSLLAKGDQFTIPLLKQYHFFIGIITFAFGIIVAVGKSNFSKMIIGLATVCLGLVVFTYCSSWRVNLMGQIITNFIAPAICLAGILMMINFGDNKS